MTNNPHGQVPAIQRYKIGYASDEWGMGSSIPSGIKDQAGPWVRYEDHASAITALRTQQPAPATQQAEVVPHEELTREIDLILTDPSSDLSHGAIRALQWMRTWVSVPLYLAAPQPPTAQAAPAAGAVAGPDDYTPLLDDEGRMMVGTSHHYTAENIRALVAEYKALEAGGPDTWELHYNTDPRARAGVLWRVISALADEVPFAAAPAPIRTGGRERASWTEAEGHALVHGKDAGASRPED